MFLECPVHAIKSIHYTYVRCSYLLFICQIHYRYDADQNKDKKSFKGPGVLICSIDNMPTQLPREATDFFGDLLYPHVENILKSDATKTFEENKVFYLINFVLVSCVHL